MRENREPGYFLRGETDEEIEEHLLRAEDDIRNGRVRDAMEVLMEWNEKLRIYEKNGNGVFSRTKGNA